ncbi:MAG: DUF4890 domain-containing protein [Bacteroidales bacterium]|nr:DUF4890 domain-containing protein [Bacteroidales bacterium]
MMRKFLLLAAVCLMAGAASLHAQPPMGGGFPGMGGMAPAADNRTPEERTEEFATKYKLSEEQRQALLELNLAYAGKLQMQVDTTAMRDPRSMSEEEREAFFSSMQERMSDMMAQAQEISGNQEAYEDALKQLLDKKQYRKYRTDKEKEQLARQREMERQFQAGFGGFGGFGGPGGGFGGGGGF